MQSISQVIIVSDFPDPFRTNSFSQVSDKIIKKRVFIFILCLCLISSLAPKYLISVYWLDWFEDSLKQLMDPVI